MKLIFRDFLSSSPITISDEAVKQFKDSHGKGQKLKVTIRATHSGYLLNNRVYRGTAMQAAVDSWCDEEHGGKAEFCKPILRNHDDFETALGRVTSAKFTRLEDSDDEFMNDWQSPVKDGFGSGYITLEAEITDQKAIDDIINDRLLTVSTSFRPTGSVLCSICNADLLDRDDRCSHIPGRVYKIKQKKGSDSKDKTKKFLCFLIIGDMKYTECSYVNSPAQPNARTMKSVLFDNDEDTSIIENFALDASIEALVLSDNDGNKLDLLEIDEGVEFDGSDDVMISVVKTTKPTSKDPDPASSGNDGTAAMDASTFSMARVAKSLIDNNVLADSPSTLFWGSADDRDDHAHVMLVDDHNGLMRGHTAVTHRADKSHEHVIEVTEVGDSLVVTTRSASAGPDHTHECLLTRWDDVITKGEVHGPDKDSSLPIYQTLDTSNAPSIDELKDLVKDLETAMEDNESPRITADQRAMPDSSNFCGPNRTFPLDTVEDYASLLAILPLFKASTESKSRVLSAAFRTCKKRDWGFHFKVDEDLEGKSQNTSQDNSADLKGLQDNLETAKSDLEKVKQTAENLQRSLSERDEEYKVLLEAQSFDKGDRKGDLGMIITIARIMLNKDDSKDIKTQKDFTDAVDKFATLSIESLRDALQDLLPEIQKKLKISAKLTHKTVTKPNNSKSVKKIDDTNHPSKKKDAPVKHPSHALGDELEG